LNITNKFDHEITYVMMNWQREDQVRMNTKILKSQEMGCNVVVWNNNPDIVYADENADVVINTSTNFRCGAAVAMMMFSFSRYIIKMDDDLVPSDTAIQDTYDIIRELESKYGDIVIGRDAELFSSTLSNPSGEVDLIKGRLMIFNRDQITSLNLSFFNTDYDEFHHWEIALCSQLRSSGSTLFSSPKLFGTYKDTSYSTDNNSAWKEVDHMNDRELLMKEYMEKNI